MTTWYGGRSYASKPVWWTFPRVNTAPRGRNRVVVWLASQTFMENMIGWLKTVTKWTIAIHVDILKKLFNCYI